jgi:hypothetical protein
MLAKTNPASDLSAYGIPGLGVMLPEDLKDFFRETGYAPSTPAESRCNARLRVRSVGEMHLLTTPTALRALTASRTLQSGKILVKDLSRSGIAILYHEQLFPEEKIRICFQGRQFEAVVVRCRRLGEKCYEIGGRILSLASI